jgi:putative tryptophan/tyrosine transport system substrate-binding protein
LRRRKFITLLGAACASPAMAQVAGKRPLVAVVSPYTRQSSQPYLEAFLQGLQQHGRIEGQSIDIVYRFGDGKVPLYPVLVEELVHLKPDVIMAGNNTLTLICKQATSVIPIVAPALVDPISTGLITSIGRPGGNVTGIFFTLEGLPGKLLELLVELKPGIKKIGLIVSDNQRAVVIQRQGAEAAAVLMGVTLFPAEVRAHSDFDSAFQTLKQTRCEAVLVPGNALITNARQDFGARALAAGLPTIFNNREIVEAGGLMSYGIDLRGSFRRAAYFVDRILKGEKPADLPAEIPTKFLLSVNLKTAKALGLTVPPTLVARADEVIE